MAGSTESIGVGYIIDPVLSGQVTQGLKNYLLIKKMKTLTENPTASLQKRAFCMIVDGFDADKIINISQNTVGDIVEAAPPSAVVWAIQADVTQTDAHKFLYVFIWHQ